MSKHINKLVKFIFIEDEYIIKFRRFFKFTFSVFFIVAFSFLSALRFIILLFQQITTGFDNLATLLNFILALSLVYPIYSIFEFFTKIFFKDVAFMFFVKRSIKHFCIGNKFVSFGYIPYIKFKFNDELLWVKFRLDGHQISKKFLGIEQQLSDMLILPLDNFKNENGYALYTFRRKEKEIDRLDIRELDKEDSKGDEIKINDDIVWNFRKEPHGLVNGGTGGGKTFFLIYLIRVLLGLKVNLKILDPKHSVLYSLRYYLGNSNVACKHEEIAKILIDTVKEMEKRFEEIEEKRFEDKKVTNDYSDYGFKPVFLIFDELMAFMRGGIDQKVKKQAEKALLDIIAMGREAGYFVIIAMQRGSTKSIDGDIRDQLHFRCTLGKMGEDGYKMAFGENYHLKKTLEDKGTGFIQIYGNEKLGEPQEFYSPFIDSSYNFFEEVEELAKDIYPELYQKQQEKKAKKEKLKLENDNKVVEIEEKKRKAIKPDITSQ